MELFCEEFSIKKIYSVMCFSSDKADPDGYWDKYDFPLYSYELVYYLDTDNITVFSGKAFHNGPDAILYLPKGIEDSGYRVHRNSSGSCIDIYFDTDCKMPDYPIQFLKNKQEIRNTYIKLYNTWSSKRANYYTKSMSLFYDIITYHCSRNTEYIPSSQKNRLLSIDNYIEQHFHDPVFDYHELAKASGLSYSYFRKVFCSIYGVPPTKYITHLKMNYAKDLLVTNRYSVSEVAAKCGFPDIYYFSATFKKIYGTAPSTYITRKNTSLK